MRLDALHTLDHVSPWINHHINMQLWNHKRRQPSSRRAHHHAKNMLSSTMKRQLEYIYIYETRYAVVVQDLERVVEDVKRQAKIEAYNSLSGETKRIAGGNKRMAKELRFQMQVPRIPPRYLCA